MNKKIIIFILAIYLFSFCVIGISANENTDRLIDSNAANILTDNEENQISDQLNSISKKHQTDFIAIALNTEAEQLDDYEPYEVADIYHQSMGKYDNSLFMLILFNDDGRECWLFPYGDGAKYAFTDSGLDYMLTRITEYFSNDNFIAGLECFTELCDDYMIQAENGEPYNSSNLPKEDFKYVQNVIIALVIGFIVAFIVTSVMKGNHFNRKSYCTLS